MRIILCCAALLGYLWAADTHTITIKPDYTSKFSGCGGYNQLCTASSGVEMTFRLMRDDKQGDIGSGLRSASCTIYRNNVAVTTGNASYNGGFIGLNQRYEFKYSANASGSHEIQCTGTDNNGKTIQSDRLSYYVAPAYYAINAQIVGVASVDMDIGEIAAGATGNKKEIDDDTPIIAQVGVTPLQFKLIGTALTNAKALDTGADSTITISVDNDIEGYDSGDKCARNANLCAAKPTDTIQAISLSGGNVNDVAISNSFSDVFEITSKVTVEFTDIKNAVDAEKAAGRCNKNGRDFGECPYPPTLEYEFTYLVAPHNFAVDIKSGSTSTDSVKVLYYGQGTNLDTEEPSYLTITALGADGNALKNFIDGVAAKAMAMEITSTDSNYAIALLDATSTNTSGTSGNNSGNNGNSGSGTSADSTSNVTTIPQDAFTSDSTAKVEKILSVRNADNSQFNFATTKEPSFGIANPVVYYAGKKSDSAYPTYNANYNDKDNIVFLRGRINPIDADNVSDYTKMPETKIYYEFYCLTCDMSKVRNITGATSYARSPTASGWWIDSTFDKFNKTNITATMLEATSGLSVAGISAFSGGLQTITYNTSAAGKYQVKVKQGGQTGDFATYMLYNPYYDANAQAWGSSASVTIYQQITNQTDRNFGLDTDAENTRSQGRTGRF